MAEPVQCMRCENYRLFQECLAFAFPDEIPDEIYLGEFDHSEKFPGQKNDIVFKEVVLSEERQR